MLELIIFVKYVLMSAANAQRFAAGRLVDGSDLVKALIDLEHHYEPNAETVALNDVLRKMQDQMAKENVKATKHIDMKSIIAAVGTKERYAAVNRVCSRLVHPTAWSVLAMNKGRKYFSNPEKFYSTWVLGF